MARNDHSIGWKISIKQNTAYSDTVQMKFLEHYVKLDPPPTSAESGLVLIKIKDGLEGLMVLSRDQICNYFQGFFRGFRKKFNERKYVDVYENYCLKKDYDVNNELKLYKMKTFKNKCSNLVTGFNRKMQSIHSMHQKAGTLSKHWRNPPYVKMGKHVESLNCKKVMSLFFEN